MLSGLHGCEAPMAGTIELRMRVPAELESRLDALAHALGRSRSWVLEQALESFIQIEDIKQALAEAEAGDFATEEEVTAAFGKWRNLGRDAG
jgi:predicted transcriptional regulator